MKVVITGGAGFIGSHLATELLNHGHRVVAQDNLSTGNRWNIEHLAQYPGFRFVEGNVLSEAELGPLVAEADLVYHLAASVGVTMVTEHLIDTLENNVRGTENVLKLAASSGGKMVILASTSEVYGKNQQMPWKEDADLTLGSPSIGRWGYASSKILDEFLALAYHKELGLPVVILRLFNTVGPRQSARYGMVLPRFVEQALRNDPITVHSDGEQTRCFTRVRDVVEAMVEISSIPSAQGQIFNVGSINEITINNLAALVKETLSSDSPIVHIPYNEAHPSNFEDMPRRLPDISKLQAYIDFQPVEDLRPLILEIAQSTKDALAGDHT